MQCVAKCFSQCRVVVFSGRVLSCLWSLLSERPIKEKRCEGEGGADHVTRHVVLGPTFSATFNHRPTLYSCLGSHLNPISALVPARFTGGSPIWSAQIFTNRCALESLARSAQRGPGHCPGSLIEITSLSVSFHRSRGVALPNQGAVFTSRDDNVPMRGRGEGSQRNI